MPNPTITRLQFEDGQLAEIQCPKRMMRISRGLGSGLAYSPDGRLFAIGDRGPNLKVKLAVNSYGLEGVKEHGARGSAKVMPALEIGPALAELRLAADRVELVRTAALHGEDGKPLTGLPPPGSDNSRVEPAVNINGTPHAPDPGGLDSEGIAVGKDGRSGSATSTARRCCKSTTAARCACAGSRRAPKPQWPARLTQPRRCCPG